MTNPYQKPIHAGLQLLYLILLFAGCLIAGMLISIILITAIYGAGILGQITGMAKIHTSDFVNAYRLLLGLGNTTIGFLAPALIFAFFTVRKPDAYLRYRSGFKPALLLIALAFVVFFLPVIDITSHFNRQLSLPAPFKGIDRWIHDTETKNETVIMTVMQMKTTADLMITLLLVAVLPAIAEEFFFRGCMQSIFQRWTKNTHAAVWITAFLFSFLHFEFLGFVPRLLLGAALGYFFAWSGSIWPSVFAHFLNNAWAVLGLYMYQHHKIKGDPDSTELMFNHLWIYGIFIIICVLILTYYRQYAASKQLTYGKELD